MPQKPKGFCGKPREKRKMADASLVVAIENALARKQSMESAMQSLVNSGYSREEVQEAARQVQLNIKQEVQLPIATSTKKSALSKAKKIILLIIFLSIIAIAIGTFLIIKII